MLVNLFWILLVILVAYHLYLPRHEVFYHSMWSCFVFEDRLSFTGLSEKLLHIQDDSNLDEVIEALFKEILTLDGAAKLQDSQVS